MSQWLSLVQSFFINCINRFGHDVISEWYFQVWTEFPVNGTHWSGSLQEFFEFYKQTALLIKGISPSLKVGPAAENFHTDDHISEQLLKFCEDNNVPIDFYSCNIYHNRTKSNHKEADFQPLKIKEMEFEYKEKNHTKTTLEQTYQMLETYNRQSTEFIMTRWNFSWDVNNSLHDTAFMATFIIDNLLHSSASLVEGIGFLSVSDILYEWNINNAPFYGGSGLMNTDGVKKSAYYSYVLLSKLGSTVIVRGENYIVTKQGENIQILVYNHT